jgi:hypothetical protein
MIRNKIVPCVYLAAPSVSTDTLRNDRKRKKVEDRPEEEGGAERRQLTVIVPHNSGSRAPMPGYAAGHPSQD